MRAVIAAFAVAVVLLAMAAAAAAQGCVDKPVCTVCECRPYTGLSMTVTCGYAVKNGLVQGVGVPCGGRWDRLTFWNVYVCTCALVGPCCVPTRACVREGKRVCERDCLRLRTCGGVLCVWLCDVGGLVFPAWCRYILVDGGRARRDTQTSHRGPPMRLRVAARYIQGNDALVKLEANAFGSLTVSSVLWIQNNKKLTTIAVGTFDGATIRNLYVGPSCATHPDDGLLGGACVRS